MRNLCKDIRSYIGTFLVYPNDGFLFFSSFIPVDTWFHDKATKIQALARRFAARRYTISVVQDRILGDISFRQKILRIHHTDMPHICTVDPFPMFYQTLYMRNKPQLRDILSVPVIRKLHAYLKRQVTERQTSMFSIATRMLTHITFTPSLMESIDIERHEHPRANTH